MYILIVVNYGSYCSRPSFIFKPLFVLSKKFIFKTLFWTQFYIGNGVNIQIIIIYLLIAFMIIKLPGKNLEELLFL